MIHLLALSIAAMPLGDAQTFEVANVESRAAFAGKLGTRVMQTLTLTNGKDRIIVRLGREHTRCGKVHQFHVGERVTFTPMSGAKSMDAAASDVRPIKA